MYLVKDILIKISLYLVQTFRINIGFSIKIFGQLVSIYSYNPEAVTGDKSLTVDGKTF